MTTKKVNTATKVLVIGGGLGGVTAITGLRKINKTAEIVLVEPKEYLELYPETYRSVFDEENAVNSLVDLRKYCAAKNVTHIKTVVSKLTANSAVLANGTTITFEVAVVAVGGGYAWAACGRGPPEAGSASETSKGRQKVLQQEGDRLLQADSVLIVGGGLIGVELAGDVAYYKKQQGKEVKVTLAHSGDYLCPAEMTSGAGVMALKKLQALGVTVVLGDRAVKQEDGTMVLKRAGTVVQADVIVMTTGNSPINQFMDASLLNDKGWVETDDFFRVRGAGGRVFSIGDCCTLLPNAGAMIVRNQGIIAANMQAVLKASSTNTDAGEAEMLDQIQLTKYFHGPDACIATIGGKDGVAALPFGLYTQYFLPWFKNNGYMNPFVKWKLGV
jgi:NADH dehydrogenase FAD-containing subunit